MEESRENEYGWRFVQIASETNILLRDRIIPWNLVSYGASDEWEIKSGSDVL